MLLCLLWPTGDTYDSGVSESDSPSTAPDQASSQKANPVHHNIQNNSTVIVLQSINNYIAILYISIYIHIFTSRKNRRHTNSHCLRLDILRMFYQTSGDFSDSAFCTVWLSKFLQCQRPKLATRKHEEALRKLILEDDTWWNIHWRTHRHENDSVDIAIPLSGGRFFHVFSLWLLRWHKFQNVSSREMRICYLTTVVIVVSMTSQVTSIIKLVRMCDKTHAL